LWIKRPGGRTLKRPPIHPQPEQRLYGAQLGAKPLTAWN
jgi:hypothetical protein